jgi:hypothetical protein
VEDERETQVTDTRVIQILRVFETSLLRYPEILRFTELVDYSEGTVEFRLRLARRTGGTTTGDSKERKDV